MLAAIPSSLLFLLAMVLLVTVLLRMALRRSRRRGKNDAPLEKVPRPVDNRDKALIDAPAEVLRWQVEMHETARDLKGEIDTKLSLLQILIGQARQESDRLESAIDRAEKLGISPCRDTLEEIQRVVDQWGESDKVSGEGPGLGNLPHLDLTGTVATLAEHRKDVYRLADEGLTATAIAQRVGATLGDVELLLSLRSAEG